MRLAYVNEDTGQINSTISADIMKPPEEWPPANSGEIIVGVPDGVGVETHYWDGELFVAIPENNNQFAEWDWVTKTWVDSLTYQEKLDILRANASISKFGFLQGMVAAGLMSSTDASELSMNRLTPDLEAHLVANVSQPVREVALMEWASTTTIHRNDKFIVDLMAELMSDQYLDQIFGVNVQAAEGSNG